MKNITVSNQTWKRLRQHRDSLKFKHYNETLERILVFYEMHQSLLEEQTDEIMNKNERIIYNKLKQIGKEEIYKGNGLDDFYHMEDSRLVVDKVKSESTPTLSDDQKRLMKHLIKIGIRYRIWNVDKSGNTKIVYDSDNNKRAFSLEERTNEIDHDDENKMWNI